MWCLTTRLEFTVQLGESPSEKNISSLNNDSGTRSITRVTVWKWSRISSDLWGCKVDEAEIACIRCLRRGVTGVPTRPTNFHSQIWYAFVLRMGNGVQRGIKMNQLIKLFWFLIFPDFDARLDADLPLLRLGGATFISAIHCSGEGLAGFLYTDQTTTELVELVWTLLGPNRTWLFDNIYIYNSHSFYASNHAAISTFVFGSYSISGLFPRCTSRIHRRFRETSNRRHRRCY